jgi:membrane-associated phospholipid phosphatase
MYNPIRDTMFWSIIRASPFIYFAYGLLNIIVEPTFSSLFFTLSYGGIFIMNMLLKVLSKGIYNALDTDYIFPFGQGSRPKGATNCGTFAFVSNPDALSFGMPSGHSQLAWFFSTYFILKIWDDNFTEDTYSIYGMYNKLFNPRIIILLVIAILVSYSRVKIEGCHTTGQVITGGVIGIISGFIVNYIEKYIKNITQ